MKLAKWTIFQLLTICLLVALMLVVESFTANRNVPINNGEATTVIQGYQTLLFIGMVLGCFYLLFLFEVKKGNEFFQRSFWKRMPTRTVMIATGSVFLFMVASFFGPLFTLVQNYRFLLYLFIVYFLFLFYLFVFSMVLKYVKNDSESEKPVHLSLIWSVFIFVCIFFFIPSV